MVTSRTLSATLPLTLATALLAGAARADDAPAAPATTKPSADAAPATPAAGATTAPSAPAATNAANDRPKLHHAPVNAAYVGDTITIGAVLERPDRMKRALLVYRGQGVSGEVPFERSSNAALPYVAVLPESAVRGPALGYAIEIETTENERLPAFATRESLHPVAVIDAPADAREAALLARLEGRRSVVRGGGDYVGFGRTTGTALDATGAPVTVAVQDRYYRAEASYAYRLLRTVSEFGLRTGIVRGRSLVPGTSDSSRYDVGVNYAAPRIRLRAADLVHLDAELLTSVTEVGFSGGGSGALLLGDPYGTKLTLGFEGIEVFGVRGYSRLDIVASRRLTLSPTIEVTNMPHAERAGVRLVAEGGINIGRGFELDLRGGYQARSFDQGGPTVGGALAYAF